MKEGIYLIPSKKEFLEVIDNLIAFENERKSNFLYLHKHLTSSDEVKKEIAFINHCQVNVYQGFRTNALIKVSLTSIEGDNFNVTYSFKTANSTPYIKLYDYFKRRCDFSW